MRGLLRAADRLAESTVVLSYGGSGYRLRRQLWDDPNIEVDLSGQIAVVTGANAGLGYATARALAARAARVILVCRSEEKGEAARAQLAQEYGAERVTLEICDLSDLRQVGALCDRLLTLSRIDVLINNAGVMLHQREESAQGHEKTFATNVLSGFMLTRRLAPQLAASTPARVIHVTSGGMYTQRLHVGDLQWERRQYDGVVSYAQSKRAQVVLNELWAARLPPGVTSNCMHPGWAATPGVARSLPRFNKLLAPLLRNAEQGADTAVWLAASPAVAGVSGNLFLDREERRTHVFPKTRISEEAREALWDTCERLTADGAF